MVQNRHKQHWPDHLPQSLSLPAQSMYDNLVLATRTNPTKASVVFYGHSLSYQDISIIIDKLGAYLQKTCGVKTGDRVILDMQSSPQFICAYYACLSIGAVVVPISPMNVREEIDHYCTDSGARVAITAQSAVEEFQDVLTKNKIDHLIVTTYSDYIDASIVGDIPDEFSAARQTFSDSRITSWHDTQQHAEIADLTPVSPESLAAILYTSGTTGNPKGCMHTHQTLMHTTKGAVLWEGMKDDTVILATAPMFHVTGMQHSMNAGIFSGATIVILPRWSPSVAGELIETYRCTHWANVPTMVVDLLADASVTGRDLSSLINIFGGGTSMPEAVAQKLYERCQVRYMEAYGMTETISQTHMNPHQDLRKQCLGIPTFDTESTVIDPETLEELGPNETGEIISSGPQVMMGYWQRDDANKEAFIDIDGKRFFRTGDLGRYDTDGFFYISDRIKRMINAAGYKVWPAEVEATLYKHPAIKEVAIISSPDNRRGETVKAVVVLKEEYASSTTESQIIDWSREHMASYKIPRAVTFTKELPRSGTGKIQWRLLQDEEWAAKQSNAH